MIEFRYSQLLNIVIHNVGNKANDEGCQFSSAKIEPNNELRNLLLHYFVTPFKSDEYNCFYHESDLNLNEVYSYVSKIFDCQSSIYEQSINLAKHLYEKSTHPKIKGGEFYVVYFKGCMIDDKIIDAVGLFKSENKDTFLRVYPLAGCFEIESEKGININKLDKGCLIFNTEKETGYLVAVVDNTNKGVEAKYWMEDFLHISPHKDDFHNTQNVLSLCRNFVEKELPQEFDVSRADQAILLSKSVNALRNNSSIDMKRFAKEVFIQPDVIDRFSKYKTAYQQERDIQIDEIFDVSEQALKKKAKGKMSTIRLDKNFDISIHGGDEFIQRGYDENKEMYYYQLFFKEEK